MDKVLVLPDRHNPFQMWMMGACISTGLVRLLETPNQEGVTAMLPHYVLVVWYLFLLLGGVIGLLSMLTRDVVSGFLIERSAMWLLASATVFYVVAYIATMGLSGSISLIFVGAFGAACVARGWKIGRGLRSVTKG